MAGRGRPFVVAWRDEDTEAALHAAYPTERREDVRPQLHALCFLRSGERRLGEVATVLSVNYRSVQHWVAWYRTGSLPEVRRRHARGYGQPSRLTVEQQEHLASNRAE